jgi:hypothetical protein
MCNTFRRRRYTRESWWRLCNGEKNGALLFLLSIRISRLPLNPAVFKMADMVNGIVNYAIPSYLFNSTDASNHIFELLTDPAYLWDYSGPGISSPDHYVTNWTTLCSAPQMVFLSRGPLIGCLLYPNVTRNVKDGSLPNNLTDIGFSSNAAALNVRSLFSTCLITYCASQTNCATSNACDSGNLLTNGYELSAGGVAECWLAICSESVSTVNPDIAGIGVWIFHPCQTK